MYTESKMKCPHCGLDITLDELFKTQMGERMENEKARIAEDILRRKDEENAQKVAEAVRNATEEQGRKITELLEQIKRLNEINKGNTEQLTKMNSEQFELQQRLNNVKLEAQKEFNARADELIDKAKKEAVEDNSRRISEYEKKISDLTVLLNESQRKLEQGSQQFQGEIQEIELEDCLHLAFPMDRIEEVDKGKQGADVIQTVVSDIGRVCGVIVWESKNVKTWKNEFIPKLRGDMEKAGGDIGVLVSTVFGRNMEEFTCQDGVWLIRPSNLLAIAGLLRNEIIAVSKARSVAEHKETIQDAVYEFVTSAAFRNRIENIGKQYIALKDAIYSAKVRMDREWSKQMTMLDSLVENTQSILGDVDAYLLRPGPEDE